MADVAPIAPQPQQQQKKSLAMGQSYVAGRIASRRRIATKEGALHLTVMKLPAADAYSHPITLEVRSKGQLGAPGDDWSGVVRLNGYPRSYESKPDADGEIRTVITAQIQLDVVEE